MTQRLAGADSRTQKETDAITKAAHCDSVLLRMCKETIAGLMRCVLCRSLGTHCTAFAGQILAHSPLPHSDLQTMVLAFISCVSASLHIAKCCCVPVDAATCLHHPFHELMDVLIVLRGKPTWRIPHPARGCQHVFRVLFALYTSHSRFGGFGDTARRCSQEDCLPESISLLLAV
jgi:hypothetical protein